MKKKIALFMVAALLFSVGLILSCGGDDEPVKKEDPAKTTPATDVKYTVTFDTNGGTPATIEPITVDAGKTVGAAKWPDDPTKDNYVFDGWFEGTTEYTSSTKIEKDVTIKAQYSLRPAKNLGGFTWVNTNTQQGWRSDGADNTATDLTIGDVRTAKYIVLHTKGGNITTAFSEIKVVLQSNGINNNWPWDSTSIGTATINRTGDTFIVIDISTLTGAARLNDETKPATQAKFIIDYAAGGNMILGLGLQAVYLSFQDIEKPDDAVDFSVADKAFVTAENIINVDIPTTFKTVTFNTDGGTPVVANVSVGNSLGVKYPSWVKKDASSSACYDFAGWFNGTTEYKASTPITADITLTAGWTAIPLPTFAPGKNVTFVAVNIGTNTIGFGSGEYQGVPSYDLNSFKNSKYLVLLFKGNNSNKDGFGGIQIAIQSSINPSAWNQTQTPDFTSFANNASNDEFVFVVVELSQLNAYTTISTDGALTGAKFVLNSGVIGQGFKAAWVTSETLDTASFTAHGSTGFFLTKTLGIEAP